MLASNPLGWVRGIRGRTDVAPRRVDVVANLAHRLALGSHGHHGTRDVDADPSAIAHRIEQYRTVVPDLLHIAACVRRVPPLPAPAEARHPPQEILIGDREAIRLLNPRRRFIELLRPAILGRPCQQRVVGAVPANDRCASHECETASCQRRLQRVPPGQAAWCSLRNVAQGRLQMVSEQSSQVRSSVHRIAALTPTATTPGGYPVPGPVRWARGSMLGRACSLLPAPRGEGLGMRGFQGCGPTLRPRACAPTGSETRPRSTRTRRE
jgi:hypothetical protein